MSLSLERGLSEDISCRAECSKVLRSAYCPLVSLLVLIYYKKLPWWASWMRHRFMSIAMCHQESLYCYVPVAVLDFPLGPWPVYVMFLVTQAVSGTDFSSWNEPLNPIKKWSITSITFVQLLYQNILRADHCCRSQGLSWVISMTTFPVGMHSTFQYHEC